MFIDTITGINVGHISGACTLVHAPTKNKDPRIHYQPTSISWNVSQLGGGFKYFLFSSQTLGKNGIRFDLHIFFKRVMGWQKTTNQMMISFPTKICGKKLIRRISDQS